MTSKKTGPIDNPYGKALPQQGPKQQYEMLDELHKAKRAAGDMSSTDLSDLRTDKGMTKRTGAKGMAKRTGETGMSKARAGLKTGTAWGAAEKAKHVAQSAAGKPGVQSATFKAAPRVLAAAGRVAPPIAAGLAARDIYTGLKDPNFMVGLINLFGGEEAAYNAWARQQEEEGVEMPPYEEWRKYAEEMAQAGELDPDLLEMPDTRDVAKRALAPRHSQELQADTERTPAPRYEQEAGPEDME
jgi:hypothetical protein